ncbi:hypothetical protein Trydic_g9120 [Trypoxylus dichotomus]
MLEKAIDVFFLMWPNHRGVIDVYEPHFWLKLVGIHRSSFKFFHVYAAQDRRQRRPHCHAEFLLVQLVIHLEICGVHACGQQFHNGLLTDVLSCSVVSLESLLLTIASFATLVITLVTSKLTNLSYDESGKLQPFPGLP